MEFLSILIKLILLIVLLIMEVHGNIRAPYKVERYTLDFSNRNLEHIDPYVLNNTESTVHKIILDRNPKFILREGEAVLVDDQLQTFQCVGCGISLVYQESFSKLPHIKNIIIRESNLKAIHPDAFQQNAFLRTLDLRRNMLKSFNRMGILNHMRNLVIIQLSHNQFKMDVKYPILHMDIMVRFDCEDCNIATIAPEALNGIGRLYHLNLRNNSISKFNITMPGLRTLDLSHNPLDLKGVELNQPDLEKFSCDACSSTEIDSKLFSKCHDLLTVEMRDNQLRSINDSAFKHNHFLQNLELDRNYLKRIPGKIIKMDSLKHFCFDYNPIEISQDNWKIIKIYFLENQGQTCAVKKFSHPDSDLMHKIHPVEGSKILLVRTTDYKKNTLILSNSNISVIFPHYFQTSHDSFTTLVMDGNDQFKFQPNIPFTYYVHLVEFQCNGCGIDGIYEETFSHTPRLKRLELKHNQITHLALTPFRQNQALQFMTLDENPLLLLYGEASIKFSDLQVLLSEDNSFYSAQKDQKDNGTLEELSCINCNLSILHQNTFEYFPKVKKINFQGHNLRHFRESIKLPSSLEELNLLGNLTEFPTFFIESKDKYVSLVDFCINYSLILVDEMVEREVYLVDGFIDELENLKCSDEIIDNSRLALIKQFERKNELLKESIEGVTEQSISTTEKTTTIQEDWSTILSTTEVSYVESLPGNDTTVTKERSANLQLQENTEKHIEKNEENLIRNVLYKESTPDVVKASFSSSGTIWIPRNSITNLLSVFSCIIYTSYSFF